MAVEISDMYCTECGRKSIPIPRRTGKFKEPGHLKKIYCIYCNKEVNHVEVRPFGKYNLEDFKVEFENGNFKDGLRIEPNYKIFLAKVRGDM